MNYPPVESDLKVPVRYVGTKETKYDNVCHTRTIWNGEGDEQLVPIAVAAQLARFPRVWEIVRVAEVIVGNPQFATDPEHEQSGTAVLAGLPGAQGRRPVLKLNKR